MALQKVLDSMRTTTALDSTKLSGAVPATALTNVDLVEGTKGADIASAGTMVIGTDGGYFDITGTTGVTAMTVAAGRMFTLQFDGAVVLTNSSTLKLSGAANFTTAAGDHLTFVSVAANDVRQVGFGLTDGGSPVASVHTGNVAFPATQVASADANTLDDYEEGTWTITLGGATSESGQTYSTRQATYTKIGRIVHVMGQVNAVNPGTVTGNAKVKGLPFTSASPSGAPSISIGYTLNLGIAVVDIMGHLRESSTSISMEHRTAASDDTTISPNTLWSSGAHVQFYFSLTYEI